MTCENKFLLDTNIIIYLELSDDVSDKRLLDLKTKTLKLIDNLPDETKFYHNLTIYKEVAVGINDRKKLDRLFGNLNSTLIVENYDIMFEAARIYRKYLDNFKMAKEGISGQIAKSKNIPNDCVIGATAEYYKCGLITNNEKDFKKYFPKLKLMII